MQENGCFIKFNCNFDKNWQHKCMFYQKGQKEKNTYRDFYICKFFNIRNCCTCKEAQKEYLKNILG